MLLLLSTWDLPALREVTFKNCYANTRRNKPELGTLGAIPAADFTRFRQFVAKQRLTTLRLINTCIAGHDLLDMLRRHATTLHELTIADNERNERSARLHVRGPFGNNNRGMMGSKDGNRDLRMASAAAVFGKEHDLGSMGITFTNLTSLTLNMRRRTLVLSDVFLTMTQLRSIDIAFSFLADGFQGYGEGVDGPWNEWGEDEDKASNAAHQCFIDGGKCFRFLESITLRYFPCEGVDTTSSALLDDDCEVLPMRANFGGEDAGDEHMCEDLEIPTHLLKPHVPNFHRPRSRPCGVLPRWFP